MVYLLQYQYLSNSAVSRTSTTISKLGQTIGYMLSGSVLRFPCRYLFSAAQWNTTCSPVSAASASHSPQVAVRALPILCSHCFIGPWFVLHHVYAARGFLGQAIRFPPNDVLFWWKLTMSLIQDLRPSAVTSVRPRRPLATSADFWYASLFPVMSMWPLTHVILVLFPSWRSPRAGVSWLSSGEFRVTSEQGSRYSANVS